jgi:hypothetical protein
MKTFNSTILQDLWVHIGALLSVAFGAADLWQFKALGHDADLVFLIGGIGAMGVKLINGSATTLRTTAEVAPVVAAAIVPAVVAALKTPPETPAPTT